MTYSSRFLKLSFAIFSIVLISVCCVLFYFYQSRPRVAFVRSIELVYGYNGMKQAHLEFKQQAGVWQANIDTLARKYEAQLQAFEEAKDQLTPQERKETEESLSKLKQEVTNYSSIISKQATEKEKSMTQAVMVQLNSVIEEYAKKEGYDIVLGSEGSGSILYGEEIFDITKELLEELNRDFKMLPTTGSSEAVTRQ